MASTYGLILQSFESRLWAGASESWRGEEEDETVCKMFSMVEHFSPVCKHHL